MFLQGWGGPISYDERIAPIMKNMRSLLATALAATCFGLMAEDAYIEGTGTQAILTDAKIGPNTKVEVDFQFVNLVSQARVFGTEYDFYCQLYVGSTNDWQYVYGDAWTTGYSKKKTDTARHVVVADMKNKFMSISTGGAEVWRSGTLSATISKTSTFGLALFGSMRNADFAWEAVNPRTTDMSYAKMKLYSCKVYENGSLVHYYKPWKSGSFVGLKDLCTGKLLVNVVDGSAFAPGGDISADPQWDLVESQPAVTPPTPPASGDYLVDLGMGAWYLPPFTANGRVLKTGRGILVLDDGNTFNGGFTLTNGAVRADYVASGLNATHVSISGPANNRPGIIIPTGTSFTPTVGTSGAGTIEFTKNCGISPGNADLTVRLSNGAQLTKGVSGFNPAEFDLGMSHTYALTFENDIYLNNSSSAQSIVLKNPGHGPNRMTIMKGRLSCAIDKTNNAQLNYWDGPFCFAGQSGRADDLHLRGYNFNCGTQVFSNMVIRGTKDWNVGNNNTSGSMENMILVNCDKETSDAWDGISSKPGATLTIDGGRFWSYYRFIIGRNKQDHLGGSLIMTNDADFACNVFRLNRGTVTQHSGTLTDNRQTGEATYHFAIARTGEGNETVPNAGSGDCLYDLRGGTVRVADHRELEIGATHKGSLIQTGGLVTNNNEISVGTFSGGIGRYDLLGGLLSHCQNANQSMSLIIGKEGSGVMTVVGGGKVVSGSTSGIRLGTASTGKGDFLIGPGGLVEVAGISGGSGESRLVFSGGTAKATSTTAVPGFVASSVNTAEVTADGGAIDTSVGDIALGKSLTAASVLAADYEALTYRWSFEGASLKDSVSGLTATTVGDVTVTDGELSMAGGTFGTSQVKLGDNIIPNDGRCFTIETWFTPHGFNKFSQMLVAGRKRTEATFHVSLCQGGEGSKWYLRFGGKENRNTGYALVKDKPYYLSLTMTKGDDGWTATVTIRDPETGVVYDRLSLVALSSWTPSKLDTSDGFWLGNGAWEDPEPCVAFKEIRIHTRALSEAEIAANVAAGARSFASFRKIGANKLTLTGANTYKAGTAVEAGTLALASGASLPQTDVRIAANATLDLNGASQTVKSLSGAGTVKGGALTVRKAAAFDGDICPGGDGTIGTLTADGTALSGKLVIDATASGCDRLVSTGTLDLSNLSLEIRADGLDRLQRYVLVSAPAVTGTFKSVVAPRGWLVDVTATGVVLVKRGIIVLVR